MSEKSAKRAQKQSLKKSLKEKRQPAPSTLRLQNSAEDRILSPEIAAELERIQHLEDSESVKIRKKYLKTVLYPESYAERLPDEITQPTNLYRSVREFAIIANLDGTPNSGRFSFAIQPILGSTGSPKNYQIGMVDSSAGWPTNFDSPASYVSSNLAEDPRSDPNLYALTDTGAGQWWAPQTASQTFQPAPIYEGAVYTPGGIILNNADVRVVNSLGSQTVAIGTFSATINNAQLYSFAPGVYNIKNVFAAVTGWSAVPVNFNFLVISIDSSGIADGYYVTGPSVINTGGYLQNNLNEVYSINETVSITGERLSSDISVNVHVDSDHRLVFGVATQSITTSVTSLYSGLLITATSDPSLNAVSDSGLIMKMRPIALSALVTCTLPAINAGGNIVGYSAPSGDITNFYYSTSLSVGPYQNWEVLARNNKGKMTHDGNLKDGTYVWSQPWDKNDVLMRTPSETLEYPYQGIIISGQVNPSVALSGNVEIGRLRVVIVFEYTTDSRLFSPKPCFGSTEDFDFVLAYLSSLDHATMNSDHLAKVGEFLKRGAKFMGDHIPDMMKGLAMAGNVAKLLL